MDWPRARAILLAAFTVVNLILGYAIWAPDGAFLSGTAASRQQQIDLVRSTLAQYGLVLPASVYIPDTPEPMRFLHVEYRTTPIFPSYTPEFSGASPGHQSNSVHLGMEQLLDHLKPVIDSDTQAVVYRPGATGLAARPVRGADRAEVQRTVERYLRDVGLMPPSSVLSAIWEDPDTGHVILKYVPLYDGYPVFSGYLSVETSPRGIETIEQFWVQPRGYTNTPPKAVRPAHEALLRLAGRLEPDPDRQRVIIRIELGYYASKSFTVNQADAINGWDTVPVWSITLDTGEVYYINAFNGEWES